MAEPGYVWVMTWHYSDLSGYGIVAGYESEHTAKRLQGMFAEQSDGGRTFTVYKQEIMT